MVPTLTVVARRFVVVTAFGAYRLFTRTNEFRFEIVATFKVPTLAVVIVPRLVILVWAA